MAIPNRMKKGGPQIFRTLCIILALVLSAASSVATAQEASEEEHVRDRTLLTVASSDGETTFSIAQFEEIGVESFVTSTIWTEGLQKFTGVPLHLFVEHLGIDDGALVARAINDYAITFPVEDALQQGPIIAYLRNDMLMPLRDKGPLWIVYPFDSDPEFRTEVAHARSIWQLERIEIQDQ